jgi:hypothetical protein
VLEAEQNFDGPRTVKLSLEQRLLVRGGRAGHRARCGMYGRAQRSFHLGLMSAFELGASS